MWQPEQPSSHTVDGLGEGRLGNPGSRLPSRISAGRAGTVGAACTPGPDVAPFSNRAPVGKHLHALAAAGAHVVESPQGCAMSVTTRLV